MDIHITKGQIEDFIKSLLADAVWYIKDLKNGIAELERIGGVPEDTIHHTWLVVLAMVDDDMIFNLVSSRVACLESFHAKLQIALCFGIITKEEHEKIIAVFSSIRLKPVEDKSYEDWLDELKTFLYDLVAERMKDDWKRVDEGSDAE